MALTPCNREEVAVLTRDDSQMRRHSQPAIDRRLILSAKPKNDNQMRGY